MNYRTPFPTSPKQSSLPGDAGREKQRSCDVIYLRGNRESSASTPSETSSRQSPLVRWTRRFIYSQTARLVAYVWSLLFN